MLKKSGIKAIRPGDPVLSGKGKRIGVVTSAVLVGKTQVGLALVKRKHRHEGNELAIALLPRRGKPDLKSPLQSEPAVVLPRFASFE